MNRRRRSPGICFEGNPRRWSPSPTIIALGKRSTFIYMVSNIDDHRQRKSPHDLRHTQTAAIEQAWPLGASYSQSNQQETEQSTVHCVMLFPWSQCWCVSILSSCISILLYISSFQIVGRKHVTFIWYASSFQRNIWRRNKRYTVHTFSGLMRNIKV